MNATNYKGTSVVMYAKDAAMHNNDLCVLQIIINAGADIKQKDSSGRNVLDYVMNQNDKIYTYLKNL